jgi:hypothetical protein
MLYAEINQDFLPLLLRLLFNTCPYYHDRNSRRAVQRCIRTIFSSDATPETLAGFVKAVHEETLKPSLAPSNAFVLVEWCSILLQELSGTPHWEKWGLETVVNNARALELCLSSSSRSNVKHSALVITRRGLRAIFSKGSTRQKVIGDALTRLASKAGQPSANNAIMLGVIGGVCARKPEAKAILERNKSHFYTFYTREIIGSRVPVPSHIANGLEDFFADFTTKEDVEKDIIPSLEKALLRAPEIVLNDLVSPLFHSLSDSVDLSTILHKSLLKPLLSNIKSTNSTIRHGALNAFKAAVLKCHEMVVISQIAEEILSHLKAGTPDQRTYYAEMLAALPVSEKTAATMSPALASVAGKEANELALAAETSALLNYLEWGVKNGISFEKPVIDAFVKGISDKKVSIRRLWTIRLGQLFLSTKDETILKLKFLALAESCSPALLEIWSQVTTNAIAAAQSGLITVAYIFTAISGAKLAILSSSKVDAALKKAQVVRQALTLEPKPSFLLNQRIYGKLTSDDDFMWLIQALSSLAQDVTSFEPGSAVALAWSQAIIFCICSSTVKPELRKEASRALSRLYVHNPNQISGIITAGLWRWRNSVESGEKDSAANTAKSDNQNLHLVVKSICLPPASTAQFGGEVSESIRKNQMISMLVISRPELLPRVSWIELCLRVQVDPGNLARESGELLIQQIFHSTSFDEKVSDHFQTSNNRG